MIPALNELLTAATQLAGEDAVSHGARLWKSEGGRCCPLGWWDCSQAVYVDLKTGEHDYGEPGGPGHTDCIRHCHHGMQHSPAEHDDDWQRSHFINGITGGATGGSK